MKKALVWMAVGSGLTIAVIWSIALITKPTPNPDTKPTVNPVSGEPARIDKTERKKSSTEYTVSYDGPGTSVISAPVDGIPEAYAWRHYTWSTTALYMSDGTVGVLKGYRYERVQIAAGPWIRIPRLQTVHFRHRASPDAGFAISATYYSDSPLF